VKQTALPPEGQMMQYILGPWIGKPIYVIAELGIADQLADGPKSIDELARMSRAHAPTLYRVMRALAGLGIFAETDEATFELTPLADCLRTGRLRSMALVFQSDWHDRVWAELPYSVRTGQAAFEKAHGRPAFDWFEENPRAALIFQEANGVKARTTHRAILDVYDFFDVRTLTDVGGGNGALMAEILESNALMSGVVAERPSLIEAAEKYIQARGLTERCRVTACDFFEGIPAGSDAYLLSHVLHDWNDEQCLKILRNCRRAMKTGSKLLVVESVISPGNGFSIAKLLDLEVLVMGGGRERTESEFRALFKVSGFEPVRITPTRESISIMEGIRV